MLSLFKKYSLPLAWLQAVTAFLVSMFYSEIVKLPPCRLCWYQRIFMYPLVLILFVGLWRKDKNVVYYALPLSVIGAIIAFYHYLLQKTTSITEILPCSLDNPCSSTQSINYFGFITIPLLSFMAFGVITLCLWVNWKHKS